MLSAPKKVKHKKVRKGSLKVKKLGFPTLNFGDFGLVSMESGYIHAKQLEASRQTISRHLERKGNIFITAFPDKGVTKKSAQVRIGKGVGKTKYWVFKAEPGRIIFEVSGVSAKSVKSAFESGIEKLPLKIKIIQK
jgi:large subunit ribosomal protein L16